MEAAQVHIDTADGEPLYDRLYDDGSLVLTFESGFGFVDRLDVERFGWKISAGWRGASEEPFLSSFVGAAEKAA